MMGSRFFLLLLLCLAGRLGGAEGVVSDSGGSRSSFESGTRCLKKVNFAGVATWEAPGSFPVQAGQEYKARLALFCEELEPGAALSLQCAMLDADGKEIGRVADAPRFQQIYAAGMARELTLLVTPVAGTVAVRPELKLGGNPIAVRLGELRFDKYAPPELFKGIYDAKDPEPPRYFAMKDIAKLRPAEARVVREDARPVLYVDDRKIAYKGYKGGADYRMMAEQGANIVVTHGNGGALYWGKAWDREAYRGNNIFDFSRLEDNLLRIFAASPDLRVILTVECDPDQAWLEAHPDSVLRNEAGERGIAGFSGFVGFGKQLTPGTRWAWSYASEEYQQYVIAGLEALGNFLKTSPAGNIVIGFSLAGGHDGQFVQWKYGDESAGHADYSPAYLLAFRSYLRELYGCDDALRRAWGEPDVTLDTASVFTGGEWRSKPYFHTGEGLDRKISDCRMFLSVSTARMLCRFGNVLKRSFGRPCVVQTWYSSPVWRQVSRLSMDELARGGVDIVAQVSDYAPPRRMDAPGASANYTIAASNLRNLLYVQELDHRTWRTQRIGIWDYTAYPAGLAEFRSQVIRDAASVLASGGDGFYYYDMFGSWYHDQAAMKVIGETFRMADWALAKRAGLPQTRVAVFMDERDRLYGEGIPNGGAAMKSIRLSGLTPDLYLLDDLRNPELPDYKCYIVFSPLTITQEQLAALRQKACRPGNVLLIAGPAGICGPYRGAAPVLRELGLAVEDSSEASSDVNEFVTGDDPLLRGCVGRTGSLGVALQKERATFLRNPVLAKIVDPEAVVLGRWSMSGEPGLVVRRQGGWTLIYTPQTAGVSARLLNNAAREAGILPVSAAGNAVYAGNGVAVGHRLGAPITLDFVNEMVFHQPATGDRIGDGKSLSLTCASGESVAVLYETRREASK